MLKLAEKSPLCFHSSMFESLIDKQIVQADTEQWRRSKHVQFKCVEWSFRISIDFVNYGQIIISPVVAKDYTTVPFSHVLWEQSAYSVPFDAFL